MKTVLLLLVVCCGGLYIYSGYLRRKLTIAMRMLGDESLRRRLEAPASDSLKLPEGYPYDLARFYPLTGPVAGLQCEDNEVLFICLDSSSAPDTAARERLKRLVDAHRVAWRSFPQPRRRGG